MADTYSKETRSRVMARVRARDTSPEVVLRKTLFAAGIRGWRCHKRDLPGCPDLAFSRARLVVFVDGGFWHGHPKKWWPGRSGAYWDAKITRNIARDRQVDEELAALGWCVIRLWDFDVLRDPRAAAQQVLSALTKAQS